MQYKQNPSKQAVDGMPMDMLAGLELSRRAEINEQQMAAMAPDSQQMPTVVDSNAQVAMGLPSIAQRPMPGAPMQFQSSAPAQQVAPMAPMAPAPTGAPMAPVPTGAPMVPPQQMAQAPTGPQRPMQPTQQQPRRFAVGGLASLGDMQDSRDQGGIPDIANMPNMSNSPSMYGAGQPLMMARGGVVAFRDNDDQPVDADMPSEESSSTVGNLFRGIGSWLSKQRDQSLDTQRRVREANQTKRDINATKPGLFEQLTPTERKAREEAAKVLEVARDAGNPKVADSAPAAPPVKPSDLTVQGGGNRANLDAILKKMGGGGGGFDTAKMQTMIDNYMKPTEQETAYQNVVKEQTNAIRNRPSPEVSEAERKRIIGEQFAQNQATSKPYYDQMQQMIAEERAANKARYADKDADAMIRAGLRGLSSRKPGMTGFFEGVTEGLDYRDKASELESAANQSLRRAEMDLVKARMSDEKGDRESAQRYFDSYQKNKRDAETYEIQRSNVLISAEKGMVDVEGRRERAGMGMQAAVDKLGMQSENNALRNQLGLAKLLGGNQPKPLTISEKLALDKRVGEVFGNPTSPEYQTYVGAAPNGKQLLTDLKNGRIKLDDPKLQAIVSQAKKRYAQDLMGGTNRGSSGATPYDQATADLLGQ
jgi:hypothetical protein